MSYCTTSIRCRMAWKPRFGLHCTLSLGHILTSILQSALLNLFWKISWNPCLLMKNRQLEETKLMNSRFYWHYSWPIYLQLKGITL